MLILLLLWGVTSTSGILNFLLPSFSNCTLNEFTCRNGQCVSTSLRCDNNFDCRDSSDEENCDQYLCKAPKYFQCKNQRCISNSFVCDKENDCEDYSDEEDCESFKISTFINTTCEADHWQCTDKLCIPNDWVCNGEEDCLDGSDEGIGCSSKIKCDGFKCSNGHCIPKEWVCDGHDDCNDNSDEQDCENHVDIQKCTWDERKFLCSNNKTCIDMVKACDGHIDCPDGSDEGNLCGQKNVTCANKGCSHDCVKLPTGPKCLCPAGYHNIDEKHCEDINECERYDICDQKCQNTAGSYKCYCDDKYLLQTDKKTCKVVGGEAMMVFSSKTEIRAYTLESKLYLPVAKNLKQVVGVYYDGHHIYWTDIFAEHESIVRSLEDGSERELLVTSGLGLPEDLAVDWLTGNIYFTDAEKQHIGVCTSDGSHCTVLINRDIRKPRGIVLNVHAGDMYWSDWGKPAEIAYSFMDGSDDKSFVSEDIHWPNGLAIDHPNQRLYWTDARKMSLESIRLDGTDRRIVLEGVVKHPYAIDIFENRLYWSDWATHSIQSCDKFSGKNHHTIIKESKEYIYGLKIFHSALHTRVDNPCSSAYCSDICLLKGNSYSCACPQDKVLSFNKQVCRELGRKQMLIVGAKDVLLYVKHQLLGKHEITSLPFLVKNVGSLAFDSLNNTLLISDLNTKKIISMNLNTGFSKSLNINGLGNIIAMDYDPMGNNLYMCDQDRAIVEVVNLNTMSRKILIHDMHGEIPEAIALVPEEGVMFVALKKKDNRVSHIDRFSMDGSDRTHAIDHGLIGPISLYYESDLHRVFFSDAGTGNIESTSVEGDDRHGFRSLSTTPNGLTSLNQDLFWVNENSRRLFWTEKNSTTNYNKKITLDIPDEVKKLHIISVTPKKQHHSPCHLNNGNCSHLCLMSRKAAVCSCPIGWDLANSSYSCIKREHCNNTEYLCPQSKMCILKSLVCNGHKDCTFGEDEDECASQKCLDDDFHCTTGDCIKEEQVCDNVNDCSDGSDERNCEEKNKKRCPPLHFQCDNGQCVYERFVCDGIRDCNDNSDEESRCLATTCDSLQFRCNSGACIPKSWECDHEYDCADLSDEHSECLPVTCSSEMYTCKNGKCIDKQLVCDNIDNCGDNSDELCYFATKDNCRIDEFACSSNKSICIVNSAKCNGTSECPHHEDEKDCSDCNIDEFSCDNKRCIPVQWLCDGMDDCGDNTDEKPDFCLHSIQSGIKSFAAHSSCENGFRCKNGHCIDLAFVCDGKHDCYDGSDEDGLCSTACIGEKNPCSQQCVSTPMGPMCKCIPGYRIMGDGHSCVDENECQNDPPVCSQLCKNNEGSYSCSCYTGYLLRSDKQSCKAVGSPMSLVFTSDNQIRVLAKAENSLSVLHSNNSLKITGLDYVLNKYIYFSIEAHGTIHRIDLNSGNGEITEPVGEPQKISVDWSTNNIYFYDAETRSIRVCNFEEEVHAKLIDVERHKKVSALAVDPINKVMFYSLTSWWVINSPSYIIYKCNLDGSGQQQLLKNTAGSVTDLTLNFNKKELYFIDEYNKHVSMVNYQGKMKSLSFNITAHAIAIKFFEDSVYYLTSGGYIFTCKLFDIHGCENFRLDSYSTDLFVIIQESLQPKVQNICENHTCSYLCVAGETQYKCLCSDGSIVSNTEECQTKERESIDDGRPFKVHSVSTTRVSPKDKNNTGIIVVAILIPVLLIAISAIVIYIIRRRNSGNFNVSMRFYNPAYEHDIDDEKPILQPGQHEYANPVHFNEGDSEISPSMISRKLHHLGTK